VTSNKCEFGLCDGYGVIVNKNSTARNCECTLKKIQENRMKWANIPIEFKNLKVNEFETEIYVKECDKEKARFVKKISVEYVRKFKKIRESGKGLYLYSEVKGSGKTRMAISIGNALANTYKVSLFFTTTINLLDEIKNTFDNKNTELNNNEKSILENIKNIEVLIVDDVGVEKPTPWVNEIFYSILNERMINKKITIFTSNVNIEDLQLDERIVDRINKMAMPIAFPSESIRSRLAKNENEHMLKIMLAN
jgi:DNA replication protein DnaC